MVTSVRDHLAAAILAIVLMAYAGLACAMPAAAATPAPQRVHADKALMLDVVTAGKRLVAAGEHGVIIYSDDRGAHWQQAQVPVSVTLTALRFATSKDGWAVGHAGVILHSSDGGKTWHKQLDGHQVNTLERTQAQQALQQAQSTDAPADRIKSLQRNLEDTQSAIKQGATRPFLGVWFADDARTGIAVGGYGMAVRTTDGGKSWVPQDAALDNPYGWHLDAVNAVAGQLFIAAERGHLYRSDDRGKTWADIKTPYDGTYFGVAPGGAAGSLLLYGLEGHVYRSADAGASWQQLPVPLQASVTGAARLPDGALVVIASSGAVACRAKGASEFKLVRPKGRPLVALVPAGDHTLVLAGIGGVARMQLDGGC